MRKLALTLAILVCLASQTVALAQPTTITNLPLAQNLHRQTTLSIQPRYALISSIRGSCYIENNTIYMSGTISSAGRSTYAYVKITLQKNSGSGWKDEKSWTATGTTDATKITTYTPSSGVMYRMEVYGYVSNSETNESDTIETGSVAL